MTSKSRRPTPRVLLFGLVLVVPMLFTGFILVRLQEMELTNNHDGSVESFLGIFTSASQQQQQQQSSRAPQSLSAKEDSKDKLTAEEIEALPPLDPNWKDDPDLRPILDILTQAGYDLDNLQTFNAASVAALPRWSTVQNLYGKPRILGLDNVCDDYRSSVAGPDRVIGVAGTFNSGTNLLSKLLIENCVNPMRLAATHYRAAGVQWQVPWGKHTPASQRDTHTTKSGGSVERNNVLPAVMIRDPYTWMQSMCRQNYGARFDHDKSKCPNIVPYPSDIADHPRYRKMKYLPINVKYSSDFIVKHRSLAHMYNEWYDQYFRMSHMKYGKPDPEWSNDRPGGNVTKDFHRIMLRMEDLLFYGNETVSKVCSCMGGRMQGSFRHQAEVANRNHGIDMGPDTGLMKSITKYGNPQLRRKGYALNQLEAAREILDPELLEAFGYKFEEVEPDSVTA